MQESAKQYLPQIVFDKCPENTWNEIKGLNQKAINRIIHKNLIGLKLPEPSHLIVELQNKIFEITEGNPLHLRYTQQQLKSNAGTKIVTHYDCTNLLPYSGDIARYYDALWRQLSDEAKTLALTLLCVSFKFKKHQLFELMSANDPTKITQGYKAISHLLQERNKITIYHNSFETFMLRQSEFDQQKLSLKERIKDWLEGSDYEELKWTELRKLAYELGDPKPILELEKNWLIEAICYPREPQQIILQLELGAKAAFEEKYFGKVLEFSNLKTYYLNNIEYDKELTEKIWEEAFKARERNELDYDLPLFSNIQLKLIAETAETYGRFTTIDEIKAIFQERHKDFRIRDKREIGSQIPQLANCTISVVSLDRKHSVKRVYDYIKQFSKTGWTEDLLTCYIDSLLKTSQYQKIFELLEQSFTQSEKQSVLNRCAENDIRLRNTQFLELINKEGHTSLSNFCLLYLILNKKEIHYLPILPEYNSFPASIPEFEHGKEEKRIRIFTENYILGLLYTMLGKESELRAWINGMETSWLFKILSCLHLSAIQAVNNIINKQPICYSELFKTISSIQPLKWYENREIYELQRYFSISLIKILKIIYLLKSYSNDSMELEFAEMAVMYSSMYFGKEKLLQFILEMDTPILKPIAYSNFIQEDRNKWKTFITHFSERTEHYTKLAHLARIHRDNINHIDLIKLAAANSLGYGYHKDMYLYEVLKSIGVCYKAGSDKVPEWISRITPLIDNITEYTDGDETHGFPEELAEFLGIAYPDLLLKYYFQKAHEEKLFLAQDIFPYVLRSLKYNIDTEIALATTAIDKDSYTELQRLSKNNANAKQALSTIHDYLGDINYLDNNDDIKSVATEKEVINYETISPNEMKENLSKNDNHWDQGKFLASWTKYWLHKSGTSKEEIYQMLSRKVEEDGLYNSESELLDVLYPLAYEFDNDRAFEYLCWSHANDYGWSYFWTYLWKAEERWDYLKRYYPKRYIEFLEKTIVYSGRKYGKGGKYFIPLPRIVEFLCFINELKLAEQIIDAGVNFAGALMADLELPDCHWLHLDKIEVIDILLQRLLWPSPLVRERTASAIGQLLKLSPNKEQIYAKLLNWIKNQKMETTIAIGLLPIAKSAETGSQSLKYIKIHELIECLPITSLVIDEIIKEIIGLFGEVVNWQSRWKGINVVPVDYIPSDFFERYIKGFLPPIYADRVRRIERNGLVDFTKQWAYSSAEILGESAIEEQVGDVMDFLGNNNSFLNGMSSYLSEIYRSAFLRVLQAFYMLEKIPDDIFLMYAYGTLPVDLSF